MIETYDNLLEDLDVLLESSLDVSEEHLRSCRQAVHKCLQGVLHLPQLVFLRTLLFVLREPHQPCQRMMPMERPRQGLEVERPGIRRKRGVVLQW